MQPISKVVEESYNISDHHQALACQSYTQGSINTRICFMVDGRRTLCRHAFKALEIKVACTF